MDKEGHEHKEKDCRERGRTWTTRTRGPIRFRKFTDIEGLGRRYVYFSIQVEDTRSDLKDEVQEILEEYRKPWLDSEGKLQRTGLEKRFDRLRGFVWRLPATYYGLDLAEKIEARLLTIASDADREQPRSR